MGFTVAELPTILDCLDELIKKQMVTFDGARRRSNCSFAKISETASSDGAMRSVHMAFRPTSSSYG